jgi:hypothetical protein
MFARGAGQRTAGSAASAVQFRWLGASCVRSSLAPTRVLSVGGAEPRRAGHHRSLTPSARRWSSGESGVAVRYAVDCAVRWHSDKVRGASRLNRNRFASRIFKPIPLKLELDFTASLGGDWASVLALRTCDQPSPHGMPARFTHFPLNAHMARACALPGDQSSGTRPQSGDWRRRILRD